MVLSFNINRTLNLNFYSTEVLVQKLVDSVCQCCCLKLNINESLNCKKPLVGHIPQCVGLSFYRRLLKWTFSAKCLTVIWYCLNYELDFYMEEWSFKEQDRNRWNEVR